MTPTAKTIMLRSPMVMPRRSDSISTLSAAMPAFGFDNTACYGGNPRLRDGEQA